MSRPPRIQYPDAWYHVMNRGRRGEEIFEEKKDYNVFIDLLKEWWAGPREVSDIVLNSSEFGAWMGAIRPFLRPKTMLL